MLTIVYPGTFDPFTRGHEDLARRASRLFARVVVGVAAGEAKRPMFPLDERVAMAREALADTWGRPFADRDEGRPDATGRGGGVERDDGPSPLWG